MSAVGDARKRRAEATPERAEQGDGLEAVLANARCRDFHAAAWRGDLDFLDPRATQPCRSCESWAADLATAVRAHYAEQAEVLEVALSGIEAEADLASRAGQRARLLHMVATARAAFGGPR